MPADGSGALPALDAAIAAIAADHEHGASYLARQAALALAAASAPSITTQLDAADRRALIHAAAQRIASARPSMAALANTAARIWQAAAQAGERNAPVDDQLVALHEEATSLGTLWVAAARAIGDAAIPLLGGTLYTISRSGTVEAVLTRLAHERAAAGLPRDIIVAHSLPGGEGVATAKALASAGWHVTLVADAACGIFAPRAAAVVCGADSVRADGSVVNKVGTLPLALAASATGIPVYVLCETLKIAAPDFPLALEELAPLDLGQRASLSSGIATRNPAFERTPGEYITAVVTECGTLSPALLAAEAQRAAHALATLGASG